MNCIDHDRFECTFLQNANIKNNFFIDNFNVVTPLRCLYLYENNNTKTIYDDILKMESHCAVRKDTQIWKLHENNIIKPLKISGLLTKFSQQITDELLQKICGILDVNTFEVRTPTFEVCFPIVYIHSQSVPI